ncbi:hypothetical protein COB21_02525 [Candidatus Aerophobetes bacterium]|uniref:SUF system FeS cluster assembly SufBD core domain-containing protein n=1 Tax=Aerophobetes bacterium TaxID=2030807 RepID=A0A2A4X728_UNCAE|nr:MAG: hypothetical protein COB21_02525 [Candidatus Aerophobetes bacterium]
MSCIAEKGKESIDKELENLYAQGLGQSLERFPLKKVMQTAWQEIFFGDTASFSSNKRLDLMREKECYRAVFCNGYFLAEESFLPDSVNVYAWKEAKELFAGWRAMLSSRCEKLASFAFGSIGKGFEEKGAIIHVQEGAKIEKPLYLLYLTDPKRENNLEAFSIEVMVGSNAAVSFISEYPEISNTAWINGQVKISIEKEGRCTWLEQVVDSSILKTQSLSVLVKEDARFDGVSLSSGSSRGEYTQVQGVLEGKRSFGSFRSLSLLKEGQSHWQEVAFYHQGEATESHQLIKTVVSDKAFSSFAGCIDVSKEAQQTDAYQLNENILLGERGVVFSCPGLEIRADDVKASHGCTISKLDKGALFYLMSRGVDARAAERLLLEGFCMAFLKQAEISTEQEAFAAFVRGFLL